MKGSSRSKLVVAQSIALALAAAGAWAIVVRPLNARLGAARAELASVRRESETVRAAIERESTPARVSIQSVVDHTQKVQELCDRSTDSARIYDHIGRLAQDYGVRIERMEPKRVAIPTFAAGNQRAARKAGKKSDPLQREIPAVVGFGYSIDATGTFGSVASLIHAIEFELGMSKVIGIRLAPSRSADGSARVRAIIDTAHFGIDRPLTHVHAKGEN